MQSALRLLEQIAQLTPQGDSVPERKFVPRKWDRRPKPPPPLRGYQTVASARSLVGIIGPMAAGHITRKEAWNCTSGMFVFHSIHDVDGAGRIDTESMAGPGIRQYIRCRKCRGCGSWKRAMWVARAIQEAEETAARGKRTWVLTATHRVRLTENADAEFSSEITRALKRLRKLTEFRYLLVFERHKIRPGSVETVGYPHCHALIHEVGKILWSDLSICFSPVGYMKANLLVGDPRKAAGYVGKYMTKGDEPMVSRVRASIGYGEQLEMFPTSPTGPGANLPEGEGDPRPPVATAPQGEVVPPSPQGRPNAEL